MQLGMIGLGRMGGNIVRRLIRAGHSCVVYDADPKAVAILAAEGATPATSLADLVEKLDQQPRAEDDVRRARELAAQGIRYMDVGTSGGVWGLERGYCLMIGGEKAAFEFLDPIFAALAPGKGDIPASRNREGRAPNVEQGYLHAGPSGAGHFVKMIHNGIEYGMMQAMAEGFDILRSKNSPRLPEAERFDLDVADIAEVWRRGSVVTSWLLDLTAEALAKDEKLESFSGVVEDSGEGRWTIEAAIEEAVPADVLAASLFTRFRSRQDHTFAEKVLSAMRLGFGGHVEAPKK
ncbi:MAG: decarboxylating 6-phosphogluconate dehydrogenase [Alphaproteobacteria bacterium]|nr:decarboxylating 6-phosphogluconate dehydrogenase [Alphaproteobacteria bacterium]